MSLNRHIAKCCKSVHYIPGSFFMDPSFGGEGGGGGGGASLSAFVASAYIPVR